MREIVMCSIANALGVLSDGRSAKIFISDTFNQHLDEFGGVAANLALVHWYDAEDFGYYGIIWIDETGTLEPFIIRLSDRFSIVVITQILTSAVIALYTKLKVEKETQEMF